MATLSKTLTITSAAGDLLSDALALSMNKDVTIAAGAVMKLVTVGSNTTLCDALGRSIVYLKNTSSSDTITVHTDKDDDGTGDAIALILEIKGGEFAVLPAALDHKLLATASNSPKIEVGIFTEA